jgi:hypothetical protein
MGTLIFRYNFTCYSEVVTVESDMDHGCTFMLMDSTAWFPDEHLTWKCPSIKFLCTVFMENVIKVECNVANMVWIFGPMYFTIWFLDEHWDKNVPWQNFNRHIIVAENVIKPNVMC